MDCSSGSYLLLQLDRDWSPEERNQWLRWDPTNANGSSQQPLPAASSPPATMLVPGITGTSAPTLVTLLPSGLPAQPSSPTAAGSSNGSRSNRISIPSRGPDTPRPLHGSSPASSNPSTITAGIPERSPDSSFNNNDQHDDNDDEEDDSILDSSDDSRRADRRQQRYHRRSQQSSRSQSRSNVTAVTITAPSAIIPSSPPQSISPIEPSSPPVLPDAAPLLHSPAASMRSQYTQGGGCGAAQTFILVGLIIEAIQLAALSFFPGGPFINTPAKYVSDAFGVFLLRMPSNDDIAFIKIWWTTLAFTILSSLFAISIRKLPSHSPVNGILFIFSWLGSVFGVAFAATLSSVFLCADRSDHGITIQVLLPHHYYT